MDGFLRDSDNMLALLDALTNPTVREVGLQIAGDFKRRRIEKGLTRNCIAERSGVALASIARFERTGQISLKSLIELAIAINYLHEVKTIFATPKYQTMEELQQIRANSSKKKAVTKCEK